MSPLVGKLKKVNPKIATTDSTREREIFFFPGCYEITISSPDYYSRGHSGFFNTAVAALCYTLELEEFEHVSCIHQQSKAAHESSEVWEVPTSSCNTWNVPTISINTYLCLNQILKCYLHCTWMKKLSLKNVQIRLLVEACHTEGIAMWVSQPTEKVGRVAACPHKRVEHKAGLHLWCVPGKEYVLWRVPEEFLKRRKRWIHRTHPGSEQQ